MIELNGEDQFLQTTFSKSNNQVRTVAMWLYPNTIGIVKRQTLFNSGALSIDIVNTLQSLSTYAVVITDGTRTVHLSLSLSLSLSLQLFYYD